MFDQELKVFCNIENKLTNAKELWQKFKNNYLSKSWENRLHLKRGKEELIFRFEYYETISMFEYLKDYNHGFKNRTSQFN